ncbi:MAG: CAP domain-containing protein [Thermoanaerobaculia bacterium]
MERLAADLARVFGSDAVEVRRASTGTHETHATSSVQAAAAEAIVAAMNEERARYGLEPLVSDARLAAAANDRAADMIARGYFAHVDPDGTSPFVTVVRHGYRYQAVGENLAVGYRTAQAVVEEWMRSPGHRENILSPKYAEVGIAIDPRAPVSRYSGPTVVAMYGAERGSYQSAAAR